MEVQIIHVSDNTQTPAKVIMDALDQAQQLPSGIRGIVMLTSGSYGLEKTLRIPDGSTLIGEPGRDVRLWPKVTPDGTHMCIPGSKSIIQGLTFSGRENAKVTHTIKCHLFGVKGDVEIKQLNVVDCRFVDAYPTPNPPNKPPQTNWDCCSFKCKLAKGIAFDSCVFDKGDRMCITLTRTAEAIRFRNCRIGDSGYWMVNFEPEGHIRDVAFIECHFVVSIDENNRNVSKSTLDGLISISLDTSDVKFRRCLFRGDVKRRSIRVLGQPAGTPKQISFIDCHGIGAFVYRENKDPNNPVNIPPPDQLRTYWN